MSYRKPMGTQSSRLKNPEGTCPAPTPIPKQGGLFFNPFYTLSYTLGSLAFLTPTLGRVKVRHEAQGDPR